jgi:hypothetical protein
MEGVPPDTWLLLPTLLALCTLAQNCPSDQ